jgi:hypothetical protein
MRRSIACALMLFACSPGRTVLLLGPGSTYDTGDAGAAQHSTGGNVATGGGSVVSTGGETARAPDAAPEPWESDDAAAGGSPGYGDDAGPGTGGVVSTGGTVSTGGVMSTGGTVSTGGMTSTGGDTSTGGTVSTGGTDTGTGGTVSTGGAGGDPPPSCTQDSDDWTCHEWAYQIYGGTPPMYGHFAGYCGDSGYCVLCPDDKRDCDRDPSNGCEVQLGTNWDCTGCHQGITKECTVPDVCMGDGPDTWQCGYPY